MKTEHVMAAAVRASYEAGEQDETMRPLVLVDELGKPVGRMESGDYVIFYNIRGEREVELTRSLTEPGFGEFPAERGLRLNLVTMVQYDPRLGVRVAFPPTGRLVDTLSEMVSKSGLRQVKIAESEKSVHVTFYLNGKSAEPMPGEERVIVDSPRVVNYAQVPELSIEGVSEAILRAVRDDRFSLIVANFANVDIIGHIEDAEAVKRAVEAVDRHIGVVVEAARETGVTVLVTADHGTVERWLHPDGTIDTGHTDSPVPLILVDPDLGDTEEATLMEGGELGDIAPTILELLGLPRPKPMTGRSLLQNYPPARLGKRRILLLIADGWGIRDEVQGNLIAQSHTPVMDALQRRYPSTRLEASGEAVGMPPGTVGNSEVGHLHIGAGRRVPSDRARIDGAIRDGSFFENEALLWAVRGCRRDNARLHLLGIVSFYSSHGNVDHLISLMRLAKREGVGNVYVHSMLGRRGERRESGAEYMGLVEDESERLGLGRVVSVIGRFWALDREENWDRVEKAYRLLVYGEGNPVREPSTSRRARSRLNRKR